MGADNSKYSIQESTMDRKDNYNRNGKIFDDKESIEKSGESLQPNYSRQQQDVAQQKIRKFEGLDKVELLLPPLPGTKNNIDTCEEIPWALPKESAFEVNVSSFRPTQQQDIVQQKIRNLERESIIDLVPRPKQNAQSATHLNDLTSTDNNTPVKNESIQQNDSTHQQDVLQQDFVKLIAKSTPAESSTQACKMLEREDLKSIHDKVSELTILLKNTTKIHNQVAYHIISFLNFCLANINEIRNSSNNIYNTDEEGAIYNFIGEAIYYLDRTSKDEVTKITDLNITGMDKNGWKKQLEEAKDYVNYLNEKIKSSQLKPYECEMSLKTVMEYFPKIDSFLSPMERNSDNFKQAISALVVDLFIGMAKGESLDIDTAITESRFNSDSFAATKISDSTNKAQQVLSTNCGSNNKATNTKIRDRQMEQFSLNTNHESNEITSEKKEHVLENKMDEKLELQVKQISITEKKHVTTFDQKKTNKVDSTSEEYHNNNKIVKDESKSDDIFQQLTAAEYENDLLQRYISIFEDLKVLMHQDFSGSTDVSAMREKNIKLIDYVQKLSNLNETSEQSRQIFLKDMMETLDNFDKKVHNQSQIIRQQARNSSSNEISEKSTETANCKLQTLKSNTWIDTHKSEEIEAPTKVLKSFLDKLQIEARNFAYPLSSKEYLLKRKEVVALQKDLADIPDKSKNINDKQSPNIQIHEILNTLDKRARENENVNHFLEDTGSTIVNMSNSGLAPAKQMNILEIYRKKVCSLDSPNIEVFLKQQALLQNIQSLETNIKEQISAATIEKTVEYSKENS